jgi:hypothetical protein
MADWVFVASPDAVVELSSLPEAMAAAQPWATTGRKVLPRHGSDELCRICNSAPASTREHVPVRSAGNKGVGRYHTLEEWLLRNDLDEIAGGVVQHGGMFGVTLCDSCNRRSGRFAAEYRDWAATCSRLIHELPETPSELDELPTLRELTLQLGPSVRPGAFARQVLASMCTVAGSWGLTARYPEIRGYVLDDDTGPLPEPLVLAMGLFLGPHACVFGPSLQTKLDSMEWRWISVIAYPPFAFELTLAASWSQIDSLCRIDNFLEVDSAARGSAELELPLLFSHTMLPGDWRNSHQIRNKLNLDGSDSS